SPRPLRSPLFPYTTLFRSNLPDRASTAELTLHRCERGTQPPEMQQTSASPPHVYRLRFSTSSCSSFLSFVFFYFSQNSIQTLVVFLKRLAQHSEPSVHGFNPGLSQTTWTPRALNSSHNQSCIFEHLQM